MSKKIVKIDTDEPDSFPRIKSYSVSEILAAGGAEAFATKLGKTSQNLIARLKELPKEAFLTEEEAEIALEMLRKSK
ncbi:hypothetical protein [Mucilaginibacter psychrotolerans]|uniref:Uncharacterized protein n=1 Tax=Mucilaginibacter psychrotolerans TaxID=1524096 RepID=A0A4Y8S499_9SPHI|nr:hypothetical protein [Mucilaginibacter psychrotolerans]TFF33455.1 hypothetical protein E2R66_25940 [Mucilaginibacter psychrotolerans]